MRIWNRLSVDTSVLALLCLTACTAPAPPYGESAPAATSHASTPGSASGPGADDGAETGSPTAATSGDPYADIVAGVDRAKLEKLLNDMTGGNAVEVGGQSVRIAERYTPASKALLRAYWTQYFTALGATVRELTFPVQDLVGETVGHNLEAVFPGRSKDSVVAIVHYDSTGAPGREALNPAVDDNATPMAIQMEAARLLAEHKGQLDQTVRFVATDYEEITTIEGGKAYVAQLQREAKAGGFKIVAAVDGELSGWNCWAENGCGATSLPPPKSTLTVSSCTSDGRFAFPALGQQMADVATRYSTLKVHLECDNDTDGSELYNFWKIGVPAFYFEEFGNDGNHYYDEGGQDTMDHIDLEYFFKIGQTAAVFIAKLVGISP
jgi:hypothetical protein